MLKREQTAKNRTLVRYSLSGFISSGLPGFLHNIEKYLVLRWGEKVYG